MGIQTNQLKDGSWTIRGLSDSQYQEVLKILTTVPKQSKTPYKKVQLYTANRIPLALSNLCYEGKFTVFDVETCAYEATNTDEFIANLRKIGFTERKLQSAGKFSMSDRVSFEDVFGNKTFFVLSK